VYNIKNYKTDLTVMFAFVFVCCVARYNRRRSRRQAGTERDPGQAWQRRAEGGSDDPARATLGVVDSYVRYQALFLGGGDYADVEGDAEKKLRAV
jgi:hypothetical protein